MLIGDSVDLSSVVASVLKLVSLSCCALVVASFALFAYDQASANSKGQVASVVSGRYSSANNPLPRHPGQPRRFIDGAAHALTSPIRSAMSGDSAWPVWIVATVFGLLVYGVGIGFVARFLRVGGLRA